MGKKLNKKNIVRDINAGYSINDIAEYLEVSKKTLLTFMKKDNVANKDAIKEFMVISVFGFVLGGVIIGIFFLS